MSTASPHIVVVGAGIIGTAIAWTLADRGARVTLIDQGAVGGQTTLASWAWTNATAGNPKPYFDLRTRSMAAWDQLATRLPGLPYQRSGTIYADTERFDIEAFVSEHAGWGYDVRLISPEQARQYEPAIGQRDGPLALSESEGAVEATEAAVFFADAARKAGAQVITGLTVDALRVEADRVVGVVMEDQPIEADEVVVAAGAATPRIVGPLGVHLPLETPPGLLVNTIPLPRLMTRNLLLPGLHVRQRPNGALVAGESFGGDAVGDMAEDTAQALMRAIREIIPGAENAELDRYTIGYRPMPADEFPAIGRPGPAQGGVKGLMIAVMHSGVTLAPIVGRFIADEILDGRRDPLLAPYGVDRFAEPASPASA